MSISPPCGHSPVLPSVQNVGHRPARVSMRPRISKRPYVKLCRSRVVRLADVYSAAGRFRFQSDDAASKEELTTCSRRASMTSSPCSTRALSRLIPLQFLVAHEAALVGPVGRIGRAVLVELVGPDELKVRMILVTCRHGDQDLT